MGPLVIYIALVVSSLLFSPAEAQRSLGHWKHDLEQRLSIYQNHLNAIHNIISSSINPIGPIRVPSRHTLRFSDLIIPGHSLQLDSSMGPGAAQILAEKTHNYVTAKTSELNQIQHQLESIRIQLDHSANQYIYKGQRYGPQQVPRNYSMPILGTRVFKQAQYVNFVESRNITLKYINNTNVDRVIDDTYLRNTKFPVRDSKGRPYFEGRKTFWNTVFLRELESGCCGRLKPLDTTKMMLRSIPQRVEAPVLIQPGGRAHNAGQLLSSTALIRQLTVTQLHNRHVALNPTLPPRGQRLAPGDIGLLPSPPPENFIQLNNLINIVQPVDGAEILKTLVFKSPLAIDEALLSNSYIDNRLVIGIATMPGFYFDLSHQNYLLRYADHLRNYTGPMQRVSGALVVNGPTSFLSGADASNVNGIDNFNQFLRESLVNINRPSIIHGPVQFNALPAVLNPPASINQPAGSRPPQNVLIMQVMRGMDIGSINGMRIPQDLVILPSASVTGDQNTRLALKPYQVVHVRGSRHFAHRVVMKDLLNVNGTINSIPMPSGVIPLHLNDFIESVGYSNLWFIDGISVRHLTTQGSHFDRIHLGQVSDGAQSLVVRTTLLEQPDGSTLLRAPLRVKNLNLIYAGPKLGLLNGFRPQEVLDLNLRYPYETIYGGKTFLNSVEATECFFNDINQVANWTNHLIRIDRPSTIQTVYTRLAFMGSHPMAPPRPMAYPNSNSSSMTSPASAVNIDRMNVEFYPDNNPVNYQQNWNFSPELYLMQQALTRNLKNSTGGRYRVNQVRLIDPSGGRVNHIPLGDIVTKDRPFRFADTFTMVGKVEVATTLQANRIQSNYPIDAMDLVQFDKYRIPIIGNTRAPIRLNNLVLGEENRATSVLTRLLNGISFSEFASSIMSLTRPQEIHSNLVFTSPVSFEGLVKTKSSLNGIKNFGQFAESLRNARYSFEEGLQCSSVAVRA